VASPHPNLDVFPEPDDISHRRASPTHDAIPAAHVDHLVHAEEVMGGSDHAGDPGAVNDPFASSNTGDAV
jgi:hypothetical protein